MLNYRENIFNFDLEFDEFLRNLFTVEIPLS